MARPLSPLQTAEVLLILLLNMSVWILIPFVYLHLKGEGWEFFAYPLFAAAAYCIVFREAQLMWSSDRRFAALLQWTQFTMLFDGEHGGRGHSCGRERSAMARSRWAALPSLDRVRAAGALENSWCSHGHSQQQPGVWP